DAHAAAAELFEDTIVRNGATKNRNCIRHVGLEFTAEVRIVQTQLMDGEAKEGFLTTRTPFGMTCCCLFVVKEPKTHPCRLRANGDGHRRVPAEKGRNPQGLKPRSKKFSCRS